jgi:ATP-dependent RNA helicase RhlE
MSKQFSELGLSEESLAAVEALGWKQASPIQAEAIPPAMAGKDIVGIAQTGTGKTGGFMLPTLERIEANRTIQALVLCPTRELAQQVAEDTRTFARGTSIRVSEIVGGVPYPPQIKDLTEGIEVVAATPGRFIDHLNRGNVDLSKCKVLILDEADRMLDMGFRPQLDEILLKVPRKRQTLLFSATMPNGVHALALRIMNDPVWIEVAPAGTTADGITEMVYLVKPQKKPELLERLLGEPGWSQVLVFSRTKAGADTLKVYLQRAGVVTDVMHSNLKMAHRTRALERFASGKVRVLVATDIAQRGLDVEGISHVVNYDCPNDPEDYVHRIGRTGRAGAVGTAVTFLTAGELGSLKAIEYRLGRELERISLPEFDYGGVSMKASEPPKAHARSSTGLGKKSAKELSPEELKKLLSFD